MRDSFSGRSCPNQGDPVHPDGALAAEQFPLGAHCGESNCFDNTGSRTAKYISHLIVDAAGRARIKVYDGNGTPDGPPFSVPSGHTAPGEVANANAAYVVSGAPTLIRDGVINDKDTGWSSLFYDPGLASRGSIPFFALSDDRQTAYLGMVQGAASRPSSRCFQCQRAIRRRAIRVPAARWRWNGSTPSAPEAHGPVSCRRSRVGSVPTLNAVLGYPPAQNPMKATNDQWAIVWVDLAPGPVELDALREATAALDEVGALLAMREDVSGVQSFPASESPTQRPRLCTYTTPDAIESLHGTIAAHLDAFGLQGSTHAEVRDDEEWKDAWKAFYKPLTFGEHQLLLRPSWIERQPGDPALEVVLDPGRAFGTGLHQTTQLCLHRLCALARTDFVPQTVFDLGCGSGVLSMAAARLYENTSRMLAVDIDPEATETTLENLELADLTSRIDVQTGQVENLAEERFDLLVANIRPVVLIPLAPILRERLQPGGKLTLSGILGEELERVFEAYRDAGFVLDSCGGGGKRHLDTWSALDLVIA